MKKLLLPVLLFASGLAYANSKLSDLTETTTPATTDYMYVITGGASKKIQVKNVIPSTVTFSSVTIRSDTSATNFTCDATELPINGGNGPQVTDVNCWAKLNTDATTGNYNLTIATFPGRTVTPGGDTYSQLSINSSFINFIQSGPSSYGQATIDNGGIYVEGGNTIRVQDISGNYVALISSTSNPTSNIYTLPSSSGTAGQALLSDGKNNLYFGSVASQGTYASTQTIFIPAAGMLSLETNFAPLVTISTGGFFADVAKFDDTTRQFKTFSFVPAANTVTTSTVIFTVDTTYATSASNVNVKWDLDYYCAPAGSLWGSVTLSTTTSGNFPLQATNWNVTISTWSAGVTALGWTPGLACKGRISRDPSATNDVTGDVYLHDLRIDIPISVQ